MTDPYENRIQLQGHGDSESDTRYLDITDYGTNIRLDLFSEGAEGVNETFWIDASAWRRGVLLDLDEAELADVLDYINQRRSWAQ